MARFLTLLAVRPSLVELSNSSETELLAAAQKGDRLAFELALRPHLGMLLAYSKAICGDFHVAEDVVQETALIAFRKLDCLFPEVDFASWLRGIAKRTALAARRKESRLAPLMEKAMDLAYAEWAPEERDPQRLALNRCLEHLGERAGLIVRGHYFNGLSLVEVASSLNMNLSAVKVALYRARMQLKDCVTQRLEGEAR